MKTYIALSLALAALLFGGAYLSYEAGKATVINKLASDRIEVLQDGKKIDADVLAANDDGLLCRLLDSCGD